MKASADQAPELYRMDGPVWLRGRHIEMRHPCALHPHFHHSHASLHHILLPSRLHHHCDVHGQHFRRHLLVRSDQLRMGQVHRRREVYRRGRLHAIHGHTKRRHWGRHAVHALTPGVEAERRCGGKDCADCYLPTWHHVSRPSLPTKSFFGILMFLQWFRRQLCPPQHPLPPRSLLQYEQYVSYTPYQFLAP